MSGTIGNKNAVGGKGNKRGRKSYMQEKADAEFLMHLFFDRVDQEEVETAIRSGKFSIKDRLILCALEGDTRVLDTIFKKLFPDKMEMSEKVLLIDDL